MEVGEQDLARAQAAVLLGHRILHLQHQLGAGPHLVGGPELSALARALLVANAAAEPPAQPATSPPAPGSAPARGSPCPRPRVPGPPPRSTSARWPCARSARAPGGVS